MDYLLSGRNKIFTPVDEITADNVVETLIPALCFHSENVFMENYLYLYRRGVQPILERKKAIRSEINNKCVQNVAAEIVAFKNGYFLTQPTYYVARKDEDTDKVNKLNDYLYVSGKHEADNDLVDWFHTVGVAALFIESTEGDVPCKAYAVDPRCAFVVYSKRPGNKPVMGVNVVEVKDKDGAVSSLIDVYTKDKIYRLIGCALDQYNADNMKLTPSPVPVTTVVNTEDNVLGEIPIIEYAYDKMRMSSFETVLPLLDSINIVQSNRLDGIEQFIQSLMVLTNCTLPEDEKGNKMTSNEVRDLGVIELKSDGINQAKVDILTQQLDQSQTQVLVDDLLHQVCEIAGIPFTSNSKGGTSDNVGAVYLRNGWETADTFARNTEDLFKQSNRLFDSIFLKILKRKDKAMDLDVYDIDTQFTRNEMENLQSKVQAALGLKQLGLAPEIVLSRSGISNDPTGDVVRSGKYIKTAFTENQGEVTEDGNKTDQTNN